MIDGLMPAYSSLDWLLESKLRTTEAENQRLKAEVKELKLELNNNDMKLKETTEKLERLETALEIQDDAVSLYEDENVRLIRKLEIARKCIPEGVRTNTYEIMSQLIFMKKPRGLKLFSSPEISKICNLNTRNPSRDSGNIMDLACEIFPEKFEIKTGLREIAKYKVKYLCLKE